MNLKFSEFECNIIKCSQFHSNIIKSSQLNLKFHPNLFTFKVYLKKKPSGQRPGGRRRWTGTPARGAALAPVGRLGCGVRRWWHRTGGRHRAAASGRRRHGTEGSIGRRQRLREEVMRPSGAGPGRRHMGQ
jgi:hypothetical protein